MLKKPQYFFLEYYNSLTDQQKEWIYILCVSLVIGFIDWSSVAECVDISL